MRRRDQVIAYYDKFSFLKFMPVIGPFLDNVKKMDTDSSNGAFIYALGSHKFSFDRLLVEYKMSIKYYVKHFRGDIKPEMLSEDNLRTLNIHEKSLEGKSGSVIIFNTMGFHRRGSFTNAQKPIRQVVLVNYRHLDAWVNQL